MTSVLRARLPGLLMGALPVVLAACSPQPAGVSVERVDKLEERLTNIEKRFDSVSAALASAKRDSDLPSRLERVEKQQKELGEAFDDWDSRWSKQIAELRDDVSSMRNDASTKKVVSDIQTRASNNLDDLKKELQAGGVTLLEKEGRIETTGIICQNQVLVEWLMVCKGGKTHESLLLLECRPSLLNAALIALGYKPGRGAVALPKAADNPPGGTPIEEDLVYYTPQGQRVYVYIEWTDGEKTVRRRPEECIRNSQTGKPLDPNGWVYLGGRFARLDPNGGEAFVPDVTRDVASVWHSFEGEAVLDNPGLDGRDDHIHFPITENLPPKGTKVKVVFSREQL
ncbi:MAG: hypothetical protein HYR85_16065 [Planctomycetes bacterium]|nr:hypothetical protein [Planctomycetota bacterium]MBI3846216.1 hypothetical protein [Planctomycetota bacterium]